MRERKKREKAREKSQREIRYSGIGHYCGINLFLYFTVDTHIHCAMYPWYDIHPVEFVGTELLTSGPQGMLGHVLNRCVNSVGDKQPSLS